MTEQTPGNAACVCGHARAHHTKRDSVYAGLMADYRVIWRCGWTGCGCPEFVKASTNEPAFSTEEERNRVSGT